MLSYEDYKIHVEKIIIGRSIKKYINSTKNLLNLNCIQKSI